MRADPPLVLVLDDNPVSLASIRRDLRGQFTVVEARDVTRGAEILRAVGDVAAVVAHVNLARGAGGIAFMVDVAGLAPWCARILISEGSIALDTVGDFAHAFVRRPWVAGKLAETVAQAIAERSQPHRTHRPRSGTSS